jgi:hypothetical protein
VLYLIVDNTGSGLAFEFIDKTRANVIRLFSGDAFYDL